ncbi:cell wall-binding repeat-containing protein [Peptostreptococcus faecalis]|uniref:cell wall-binding repeat-containing protein n=1 Tax=Peptostreptococcus faecalis TaxID=2045015 RepID=UPI000C7D444A|nr:cell wall-binding repeat-containing protein [Peptostreptococcus faecalis]
MKKYLKYIIIALALVIGYIGVDKVLDKLYLQQYKINSYTGDSRFTTVNKVVSKRFKKADTAILINTESIDQVVSTSSYAYSKNMPVFYIEKERVLKDVYDQMEKLGVKKVVLVGGPNSIAPTVERSLKRNGYKFEKIIESPGINLSLKMAELQNSEKKIDSIAVVTGNEFDLPNAISFSPYAQNKNIPIIVMSNREEDVVKLKEFINKYRIKKTYLIGNEGYFNTNIEKILPEMEKVTGKDRYDVNIKIIDKFFSDENNGKVYISKGGEILHKRHIASGQLINAMAISPLAADNNAPLMFINNNYFSSEENEMIKSKSYKEINEVGFLIERRNFFNVERFKVATTAFLILISVVMATRVLRTRR